MGIASDLAGWAASLRPTPADLAPADRSPADTVAVPRGHPAVPARLSGPAAVRDRAAATIADCPAGLSLDPVTWSNATELLRGHL